MKLVCQDLSIGYLGEDKPVLSGLNLGLEAGKVRALAGMNGAGKSTLLKTLGGLLPPLKGGVFLDGRRLEDWTRKERAKRIAMGAPNGLPQGFANVYDTVAMGRYPHTGWTGDLAPTDLEAVGQAVRLAGLEEMVARKVGTLSDGERQRVLLARALAQSTPVLLLDEPTAFLDLSHRVSLMERLRECFLKEDRLLVFSTHDLELAVRFADELLLVLPDGRLIQGLPEELALNGLIGEAFNDDGVVFDLREGRFQLEGKPGSRLALKGDPVGIRWTREAIRKYGWLSSEETGEALVGGLRIVVDGGPGDWQWRIEVEDREPEVFERLADLLRRLGRGAVVEDHGAVVED